MSRQILIRITRFGFVFACFLASVRFAVGQPPQEPLPRVEVAKAISPAATFSARQAGATEFKVLPSNTDLFSGDTLVTLPGAVLESKNHAIGVKSLADYDGKSPLPALETAFVLNDPKDADFDVTLDRGRIDISNIKTEGAATIRVRFWDQVWRIKLDSPGSRVAFELCGRWPPGSRFKPVVKITDKPTGPAASLVLVVLQGSAEADLGGLTLGLKSPPGPALVEWDSQNGVRPQPQKLEKLPEWADLETNPSAKAQKVAASIEKFRLLRAENPTTAIQTFLKSSDPVEQRIALVTLGAVDDLGTLGLELAGAKTVETWDFGITILRHWLGRCTGNDQKLYETLISPALGYTTLDARLIMQLLFGFSPDDTERPETFEVLVEYLAHEQAAIRNLAVWHLVRLVPQGKEIEYNPSWTKAQAEAAYREWKKLIPAGQLPPRPKKD